MRRTRRTGGLEQPAAGFPGAEDYTLHVDGARRSQFGSKLHAPGNTSV
jgi:hypothetical protein